MATITGDARGDGPPRVLPVIEEPLDGRPDADGAGAMRAELPPEALPIEPDASVGELIGEVTKDLGELVGMHVDLAKTELKEEISQTASTAKFFGIGAFAGAMTLIMLSLTLAWLLTEWLPTWAGFLIVTAVWGVATGVSLLIGRGHLQQIEAPQQTVETVKGDVAWAQQQRS